MEKIPTARQYMLSKMKYSPIHEELLIEFAKLHVEAALKAAAENSNLLLTDKKGNTKTTSGYDAYGSIATVNKKSILNSYPLDNIK